MKTITSKYGPRIRGDWNQDKTKRFWGYRRGKEMWVSPERFDEAVVLIKLA